MFSIYTLTSDSGRTYYTGRAGESYLGSRLERFLYDSVEGAQRKADLLVRMTGRTFTVDAG